MGCYSSLHNDKMLRSFQPPLPLAQPKKGPEQLSTMWCISIACNMVIVIYSTRIMKKKISYYSFLPSLIPMPGARPLAMSLSEQTYCEYFKYICCFLPANVFNNSVITLICFLNCLFYFHNILTYPFSFLWQVQWCSPHQCSEVDEACFVGHRWHQ